MPDITSLQGPVERVAGELVIRIPLAAGASAFVAIARGISRVENGFFIVTIQPWLADKLRIGEGSLVIVDNENGKFNITRSAANDEPPGGARPDRRREAGARNVD